MAEVYLDKVYFRSNWHMLLSLLVQESFVFFTSAYIISNIWLCCVYNSAFIYTI